MPVGRRGLIVGLACSIALVLVCQVPRLGAVADTLPDRLTDTEFWALSERLSEPDGYFRSDNLLSNELYYPEILDRLVERVPAGGVYLGVGPEQNFNYMVAVRPRIAFMTDVRRGNLHLQLMYKALFELSGDRADFVSRLFTKPRPAHLKADSSIADIMDAYWVTDTSPREMFDRNLKAVQDHLTKTRALPLTAPDLDGIADVYAAFYWFGPSITYSSSSSSGFGRGGSMATYYELMLASDSRGVARSYLATEAAFTTVKDLQQRNLIVPVVGNFGGARALRAVGSWVRERGATVSMFYLSNVEQYLRQQGLHSVFCANVASMPLAPLSTFVRSQSGGGGGFRNMLGDMVEETRPCLLDPAVAVGAGSTP
jgi:hypothetical protein